MKTFTLWYGIIKITTIKSRSIIGAQRAAHKMRVMSTHLTLPDGREFLTF